MTDAVIGVVLQYGLAGVVMLALAFALRHVHGLWVESQDKRIAEAQANTERVLAALNANAEALRLQSEAQKSTRDLVEAALVKGGRR